MQARLRETIFANSIHVAFTNVTRVRFRDTHIVHRDLGALTSVRIVVVTSSAIEGSGNVRRAVDITEGDVGYTYQSRLFVSVIVPWGGLSFWRYFVAIATISITIC